MIEGGYWHLVGRSHRWETFLNSTLYPTRLLQFPWTHMEAKNLLTVTLV